MKKVYYNDNTVGLVNLTSEGGIPYVAGTGIDITNDVISVTGMTAESAFTTYTAATATEIGNKADTTAMTQAISEATSGKVDTSTYTVYTAATDTAIGNKADTTAVTQSINEATSGKADTTAVTEAIDAAVSGKVDTTTYTTYTAATDSVLSGKQDTLSAGTGINITDNVISVTGGGGGGCEVEETVVYNRITSNYIDDADSTKALFVILDYLGDKSTGNYQLVFIVGDAVNNYVNAYIDFDYSNHSSSSTDTGVTEYLTVEYVNDIQDFKVTIKPVYQSSIWIKQIYNAVNVNLLVPFYTISSGNPCTVISTDVVGLVNKVKDITYKSLNNIQINSDKSKIIVTSYVNDRTQNATYITLEDLDGTNGILKPDINIPLGTSGWPAIDIGDRNNCSTYKPGEIGATVYRITYSYDEQNIDYSNLTTFFEIHLKKHGSQWYNDIQYIDFVESGSTYVPSIRNQIFVGFEPTVEWDGTAKKLIVTYPATYVYPNDQYNIGTYDVVVNAIRSSACMMGSQDLLSGIEYYAEQIQPLKPFVQQLRTDVNTLSGQVDTKISTSAVTTAVTSGSTDAEIPTAKAVYDAIPQGGGGKAIEAGRGISVATGETADTVSFNLPISAGTGNNSILMSEGSVASGSKSIAGGQACQATREGTIALGQISQATANWAVAIGNLCLASGKYSTAFGNTNQCYGEGNFVEGYYNKAGQDQFNNQRGTHAEGYHTEAIGEGSHTEGRYTKTLNNGEHASGSYNVSNTGSTDADKTLFSVGNGTSASARHNAFEIRQNGDIYYFDGTNDVKLQDKFSSIDTTIGDINTILQSI